MITYAGNNIGRNVVVFMEKKTGVRLQSVFESPYQAKKFVDKCKRSKNVILLSYPVFN